MDKKEVEIQEFNGEEYFEHATFFVDAAMYTIFAQVKNPKVILLAKEVKQSNDSYYEIITGDEFDTIMNAYYEQNQE